MKSNLQSLFVIILLVATTFPVTGNPKISQWRGPHRDGKYPETGLLKEWPAQGPEMVWLVEGLGAGQSSPVVAGDFVYVTGIPDTLSGEAFLFKFDMQGKQIWKKGYGRDFTELFPGARSTPTVVDDLIYVENGTGKMHCFNTDTGNEVWSVDFYKDFAADSVQFGYSESPLIQGDVLYCTPGGKTHNVVALNRFTGEKIWASPGFGEKATYSSPIYFEHNGHPMLVNLTATSIIGLDARTGEMYWRVHQYQDNFIHANTPIYHDGKLLVSSASRKDSSGLVLLGLSADGREADILWRNKQVINLMGGMILDDGHVYIPAYLQARWYCIDFVTGEIKYTNKDLGGGAVIKADGLYYAYTERDGEMALVHQTPEEFRVISKFPVTHGTLEHWAHPVIGNGMLLVRHGNAMMAYDIRQKQD